MSPLTFKIGKIKIVLTALQKAGNKIGRQTSGKKQHVSNWNHETKYPSLVSVISQQAKLARGDIS